MALHLVNHPLAEHVLTFLRKKETPPIDYRTLSKRIGFILLSRALADLELTDIDIETPLCSCNSKVLADNVVFIPVLRAGLALLTSALEFLPEASVGYFGAQRDEMTAKPTFYYQKLPEVSGANVFVLDPMLATGGSAEIVLRELSKMDVKTLSLISVIAAPEGVQRLMSQFPAVNIYTTCIDEKLNEKKFIVPGLGDFGDRFHGTI